MFWCQPREIGAHVWFEGTGFKQSWELFLSVGAPIFEFEVDVVLRSKHMSVARKYDMIWS